MVKTRKRIALPVFYKITIVVVTLLILLVVGVYYFKHRVTMGTSYEDAEGWIYECSQPIRVKDQGVTYMSGAPSLTPVDEQEASKYCRATGME